MLGALRERGHDLRARRAARASTRARRPRGRSRARRGRARRRSARAPARPRPAPARAARRRRAGQRRGLEQREQPRERRPQLVRDRSREAGAELLVGGELGRLAQKRRATARADDPRPNAPAGGHGSLCSERGGRSRARGHEPPLAVEHDDGSLQSATSAAPTHEHDLRVVYHAFTTHSPSATRRARPFSIMTPMAEGPHRRGRRSHRAGHGAPPRRGRLRPGRGSRDGDTGSRGCATRSPTSASLDLMLPGIDGWKLIETARGEGIGTPIIVVCARGTEHDRVHALEIGADDYLVKPFSMKELVARVRAAARRGVRAQTRAARRADRDRGAPHRPARRAGVRRRRERRPDADRVPAALRARARARPRRHAGTSCSRSSGAAARHTATAPSTSSSASCATRSTASAPRHTFIQTRYGVGYKLEPEPKP